MTSFILRLILSFCVITWLWSIESTIVGNHFLAFIGTQNYLMRFSTHVVNHSLMPIRISLFILIVLCPHIRCSLLWMTIFWINLIIRLSVSHHHSSGLFFAHLRHDTRTSRRFSSSEPTITWFIGALLSFNCFLLLHCRCCCYTIVLNKVCCW